MLEPVMVRLLKEYPKDLRFVFRHFPLSGHDKSLLAAQATEAAGKQNKFWEFKDAVFAAQQEWASKTLPEFETWLADLAKRQNLDVEKFKTDMKSDEIVKKIKAAQDEAMKLDLPGTPFTLANGAQFQENPSYEVFSAVLTLMGMKDKQFKECPPMTVDPAKKYTATIKTDKGDIVAELYPDKAPLAVNSFVFLAKKGWFDGVMFHRVLPDFVAQAGDPSNTGAGGPGYAFGNEVTPDLKFDVPGMLGMANAGPDSNGSQFFITYVPLPNLDGKYTIFGKVTQGLDVAKSFVARDASKGGDLPAGTNIISITIEEK
jgi:cyclophilin family peptidyl-prolyl cis-trans isomerase